MVKYVSACFNPTGTNNILYIHRYSMKEKLSYKVILIIQSAYH